MKRFVLFSCAAAVLFLAGVAVALFALPEKVTVVAGGSATAERTAPPPPVDRTDEVLEELRGLRSSLEAFAGALDGAAEDRASFERGLLDAGRARGETLARIDAGLTALRSLQESVQGRLSELVLAAAEAPAAPAPPEAAPAPAPAPPDTAAVPEATAAPEASPVPAPPARRSLAALFAERRVEDPRDRRTTWRLLPGSCRVGFDGGSTIHNFTARSEAVTGGFTLHLRDLPDGAGGTLRVPVTSLESGIEARDEEIHAHLAFGDIDTVEVQVLGIGPGTAGAAGAMEAKARLRFRIHGAERDVEAPVVLEFTRQRLLHVRGEVPLKMSDFAIEPKAKLGVIRVYDELTAWWDLYAEVDRSAEGGHEG